MKRRRVAGKWDVRFGSVMFSTNGYGARSLANAIVHEGRRSK
jgi:hypothetical protein